MVKDCSLTKTHSIRIGVLTRNLNHYGTELHKKPCMCCECPVFYFYYYYHWTYSYFLDKLISHLRFIFHGAKIVY